jgi:hypothetical protein
VGTPQKGDGDHKNRSGGGGRDNLGRSTIVKVLEYDKPEHACHKRGLAAILSDEKADKIIEYLSTLWNTRVLG